MPRGSFVSKEELQDLLERGWGVPEIMERYGVSRSAVYHRIHAYRLDRYIEPRFWAKDEFGWDVSGEHAQDYHLKMLRYAVRKRRGVTLRPEIEAEVDSWARRREEEGVVVTYHPGRGFGFSPRQADDEWLWRKGHYGRPVRRPPRKQSARRRADRDDAN